MILLENGYVQDGLKALVFLTPLLFVIIQKRKLKLKYFWLFFAGLALLFFGNLLDLIDEFEFLHELDIPDSYVLLQDFLEDIVGFTFGFAIFVLAVYLELKKGGGKHAI